MNLFLDQQSLGLRPYLERLGLKIRDVKEILGHNDTRKGVPDDNILAHLVNEPSLTLVTKDRKLSNRCKKQNLNVIFIDESEVVATEVLRRIATLKS